MAALSMTRPLWRLILEAAIWIYCIWQGAYEPTLFLGGLILAHIALLRGHGKQAFIGDDFSSNDLPLVELNVKHEQAERKKSVGMIVLFVIGIYLASAPEKMRKFLLPIWNRM